MSNEQDRALLIDMAERLKAMQAELAVLVAGHSQALEQYANTDSAYRAQLDAYQLQLERYGKGLEEAAAGRKLAVAIRLIVLVLLLYIAYRMS